MSVYDMHVVKLTRLKAIRKREALNQRELAEKAGLPRNSWVSSALAE